MEIRQVKLHQYKYICTACGNGNTSSSGTNVPVLGLKQSGDTELSGMQTEGIESIYWHERAAFQRSTFGRSTAGNDVVATISISLFSFFPFFFFFFFPFLRRDLFS